MSITLYLIGIGFGNEKHVTEEAANTIKNCNLILIGKKKEEKSDIANLKKYICNFFIEINTISFHLNKYGIMLLKFKHYRWKLIWVTLEIYVNKLKRSKEYMVLNLVSRLIIK